MIRAAGKPDRVELVIGENQTVLLRENEMSFQIGEKTFKIYSQRILGAEVSTLVRERPSSLSSTHSLLQTVFTNMRSADLGTEGRWHNRRKVRPLPRP
jgi:hypothetical protein